MIQLYDAIISKCIVHFVGNRGIDEGVKYSNDILDMNEDFIQKINNMKMSIQLQINKK